MWCTAGVSSAGQSFLKIIRKLRGESCYLKGVHKKMKLGFEVQLKSLTASNKKVEVKNV